MSRRLVIGLALATSVSLGSGVARADTDEELFVVGQQAIEAGRLRQAIDVYESLADRGFNHPDASYNRGVAYVARVRAREEKPGDLGRAAAAFEECLLRRPGDEGAERALEAVRNEVAKRLPVEPNGKGPVVDQGPRPRDAIAGLLAEANWAFAALGGSLLLAIALAARSRANTPRARLIATSAAVLALLVLSIAAPFAAIARSIRRTTATAVVVSKEAPWVKEDGTVLPDAPVPEAARVEIVERRGVLLDVRWGKTRGLLRPLDLRIVRPMDAS